MGSRQGLRGVLAQQLNRSCNGRGLATAPHVPPQHLWVTSGDMTLNGYAYIGAIKIRGNLVSTALRSARGRPDHDIRCDCCGRPESLGHILRVCPQTRASHIARHESGNVWCGKDWVQYPPWTGDTNTSRYSKAGQYWTLQSLQTMQTSRGPTMTNVSIMMFQPLESGPNYALSLGTLPLRLWLWIGGGFWPLDLLRHYEGLDWACCSSA